MTRALLALALCLLASPAVAQTICDVTLPTVVTNASYAVLGVPSVVGVTGVTLRASPRGSATVTATYSLPRAAFLPVGTGCYLVLLPSLDALPVGVEHVLSGHLDTAPAPNPSPWAASENAVVRIVPIAPPPPTPPPAPSCAPRTGEIVSGNIRTVRESVTTATLAKRVADLKAAGWTIEGLPSGAVVVASCTR